MRDKCLDASSNRDMEIYNLKNTSDKSISAKDVYKNTWHNTDKEYCVLHDLTDDENSDDDDELHILNDYERIDYFRLWNPDSDGYDSKYMYLYIDFENIKPLFICCYDSTDINSSITWFYTSGNYLKEAKHISDYLKVDTLNDFNYKPYFEYSFWNLFNDLYGGLNEGEWVGKLSREYSYDTIIFAKDYKEPQQYICNKLNFPEFSLYYYYDRFNTQTGSEYRDMIQICLQSSVELDIDNIDIKGFVLNDKNDNFYDPQSSMWNYNFHFDKNFLSPINFSDFDLYDNRKIGGPGGNFNGNIFCESDKSHNLYMIATVTQWNAKEWEDNYYRNPFDPWDSNVNCVNCNNTSGFILFSIPKPKNDYYDHDSYDCEFVGGSLNKRIFTYSCTPVSKYTMKFVNYDENEAGETLQEVFINQYIHYDDIKISDVLISKYKDTYKLEHDGWIDEKGNVHRGDELFSFDGPRVLKPNWVPLKFHITYLRCYDNRYDDIYDCTNFDYSYENVELLNGDQYLPAKSGYGFYGWYYDITFNVDSYIDSPTIENPKDNLTLYGLYLKISDNEFQTNFTCSFKDAGWTTKDNSLNNYVNIKQVVGTPLNLPAENPKRPGYWFAGWQAGYKGDYFFVDKNSMVTDKISFRNIYALWVPNGCSLYLANGGRFYYNERLAVFYSDPGRLPSCPYCPDNDKISFYYFKDIATYYSDYYDYIQKDKFDISSPERIYCALWWIPTPDSSENCVNFSIRNCKSFLPGVDSSGQQISNSGVNNFNKAVSPIYFDPDKDYKKCQQHTHCYSYQYLCNIIPLKSILRTIPENTLSTYLYFIEGDKLIILSSSWDKISDDEYVLNNDSLSESTSITVKKPSTDDPSGYTSHVYPLWGYW